MTGKYKTLFQNTLIFAVGSVGSRAITFLLVPFYTNLLTTAQYGTADFVMTCSYMIVPLISLVIQDAVLRFGLSESADKGQVAVNAAAVFLAGAAATILMAPLADFYEPLRPWKWYLVGLVLSNHACNILFTYAKIKDRNKLYALSSIVQTLVLALVNLLTLAVFRLGVRGYLLSNIAANLVPVAVMAAGTHILRDMRGKTPDRNLMGQMLRYSVPLVVNNLSWWILNSSDRVMLEYFLSASDLGLYTAAAKIPGLLSIVTAVFSSAWTISSLKEYDSDQDQQFFANVFAWFSLTMHMGAAAILLIVKPFMRIYVGADFFEAWKLVPLLVLGAVYFAYASFFGVIYDAAKKNIVVAFTTLLAAAVNITLNALLIPRIGTLAACISTAVGYGVIGVVRMLHSRRYFRFPVSYRVLAENSLILVIQTVLVTMDLMPIPVSAAALVLLAVRNRRVLLGLLTAGRSAIWRKR